MSNIAVLPVGVRPASFAHFVAHLAVSLKRISPAARRVSARDALHQLGDVWFQRGPMRWGKGGGLAQRDSMVRP